MLTACTKDCPDTCSLLVTKNDKGFSIKGNPEHPITLGLTCGKIQNHLRRLKSKNRITTPLLKKEGSWQEISWDQALAWQSGNVGEKGRGVYFNISSNHLLDFSWLGQTSNRSFNLPVIGSEIEQAQPGIDLAWIACSNVVNQAPDSRHLARVFAGIDCLVVVDAFMTDTAACADLILPPALNIQRQKTAKRLPSSNLQDPSHSLQ